MTDVGGRVGELTAHDSYVVLTRVASGSSGQIGGENFPVALRLLPARPRRQLATVYSYARFVDDVGDEAPGDRLALLDIVEGDVRDVFSGGTSRLAVIDGLRVLKDESSVSAEPFLDLIRANRMDQTVTGYASFDDLLSYCRFSASPVGRIVLELAGAATAANVADSDAVCNGLQVLEHCQDVGEDAAAGRVYLPKDDLDRAGVDDAALRGGSAGPQLRRVIATQVRRADELLAPGRSLVGRLSGWSRLAVAGYVAGGQATADALRRADFDVLRRPVTPTRRGT
ncbi:MAG: hpnC, partial [Pseudonocardiales bacterium]|nr:hpnC [Pseudonocardiales bacterium]